MRHRLDWRDGKLFFGVEPLGVADELEAARVMLQRSLAARGDTFTTYRGDTPCLTAGIGWAADRVVRANEQGTPIFARANPTRRLAGGQRA